MVKALRFFGACLAVLLFAARVDAATVTLAWDPNSETDLARYYVGYRTSPTGSETLVNVGNVTTWSLTTAVGGSTYYFRVYAENTAGLRSAPSAEVSTTIPNTVPPPSGGGLTLERGALNLRRGPFKRDDVRRQDSGAARARHPDRGWIAAGVDRGQHGHQQHPHLGVPDEWGRHCADYQSAWRQHRSPPAPIRTTCGSPLARPNSTSRSRYASTRRARVQRPAGVFDTPTNGIANVAGSLPVTGWAVDDVGIARVDVLRDAVDSEPAGAHDLSRFSVDRLRIASGRRRALSECAVQLPRGLGIHGSDEHAARPGEQTCDGWQRVVPTPRLRGRHRGPPVISGRQEHHHEQRRRRSSRSARSTRPRRAGRRPARHTWCGDGRFRHVARSRPTVPQSRSTWTASRAVNRLIT